MKTIVLLACIVTLINCSYEAYPYKTLPADFVKQANETQFRLAAWLDAGGYMATIWLNENEVWIEKHGFWKKHIKLSPVSLSHIRDSVVKADFFSLPDQISEPEVFLHQRSFFVHIQMNGKYHWVNLYDPAAVAHMDDSKRFMVVWNEIMTSLNLRFD